MKHAGKARMAGLKVVLASLAIGVSVLAIWSFLAGAVVPMAAVGLAAIWIAFTIFSLSFFRDPEARVPADVGVFVSPAHGTVDLIEDPVEQVFMGGRCRRISIFLSVFNVHIQNAPVAGRIAYLKHTPGKFVNAMRSDCGSYNENVLLGLESSEVAGERVAVRLIAGLIARRIVPWVKVGELVAKGERTSLIQFGSRVDLYLPIGTRIRVELGDKVKGGETIVATRA